jgi:cytochrome c oxidase subunit 2
MQRRRWLKRGGAVALLLLGGGLLRAQQPRVIQVRVKKFTFTPAVINLTRGEPVLLEFTTGDVLMGFSCYDLAVRTDIVPGKTSALALTPAKSGRFDFVCDIFCGDDHEDMQGTIVVS